MERAPYGRHREDSQLQSYRGESYYDQPVIKSGHYGQLVAAYLFVGGLAGASQLMATIADLCNRQRYQCIVRPGRYVAFFGSLVAPVFLIADLKTPGRWYNMLRIFRPTSPMSIGSWTLAAFGASTALSATLQFLTDRTGRPLYSGLARWVGIPSAAFGGLTATYTGVLLASTSTPLWASGSRLLPALFGTSAAATATAALSIAAHLNKAPLTVTKPLELVGVLSATGELLVTEALERKWQRQRLMAPLKQQPARSAYQFGYKGLGVVAPLVIHGLGLFFHRRVSRWSLVAAAAALAGSYLLRSIIVAAGNNSAQSAEDYLRYTQSPVPIEAAQSRSLVAQCEEAIQRLDQAVQLAPSEIVREVDHIEKLVTSIREALIHRLRAGDASSTAARDRAALERLNAAVSLIIAAEYPIGAIERSTLAKARDLLSHLLDTELLADQFEQALKN